MKKNLGSTLTELMVVVAILAILALLAFWALRTQVFKGYDSRRKTDIYQIKVAVEEYEKDHDCYPLPQLVVCDPGTGLQPYLNKIPCDPRTGASYYYDHQDSSCPQWYRLYASLENLKDKDYMGAMGPNGIYNYYTGSPNAPYPSSSSPSDFYGCKSGTCVPIGWDPTIPGPDCEPNFRNSTCYGSCADPDTGAPTNECVPR